MYLCCTFCNPTQAHPHATWNGPARQGELDLFILITRRVGSSGYEATFVFSVSIVTVILRCDVVDYYRKPRDVMRNNGFEIKTTSRFKDETHGCLWRKGPDKEQGFTSHAA
ncbi:unnamed protein product [Fusarium fujikuroi]|nr:unnamed protein product [Fusarium fujikuroi]